MSKMRFLQLLFVFFLFVMGCTRETWEFEQENILEQKGVLARGEDPLNKRIDEIRQTPLGKKLFGGLSSISVKVEYDPSMPLRTMGYIGGGIIRYGSGLQEPVEYLLFHELFHVYQTKEKAVALRNNEIEAYVAQYLFHKILIQLM